MADIFGGSRKRLFGFIGAGGTLGQIFGSSFTTFIVHVIGNTNLLLVSAVFLELSVLCMIQVGKNLKAKDEQKEKKAAKKDGGTWEGITAVFKSNYLISICLFMFLYTFTSTFLYFEKQAIVSEYISSRAERTSFFSGVNLAVGILTVLVQLFFTGRIIPMLGIALSLAFLPMFTSFGFLALGLLPQLWMIAGFDVLRKTLNYAITRPSREILYTVVSRAEKYKAKSFIDTFVYRRGCYCLSGF